MTFSGDGAVGIAVDWLYLLLLLLLWYVALPTYM